MPILLTKPFNPGDADPSAQGGYPHCQLTGFVHNPLTFGVTLTYEFGTASGQYYENWTKGPGSPIRTLDIAGAEVATLWGQTPNAGETIGAAIRRATYEYLISQSIAPGTIVDAPPLPPEADASAEAAPASD